MLLSLPLCRFRQVRDVCAEAAEDEVRLREVELRWLCTMAASTQSQFDALPSVRLLPDPPRVKKVAEPAEGSYERLLSGFG